MQSSTAEDFEITESKRFDHLMKVSKARSERGLFRPDSTAAFDHPAVGRTLVCCKTGKVYRIEKAVRHWLWGYYIALLIESNNSHTLIFWENISCSDELVVRRTQETRRQYVLF